MVLQTSSPMIDGPSSPLQSGTSDELSRSKSPPRSSQNLAPVAESESELNVIAIGLDIPFSDVQVNISSSSSKEEGHLNLPAIESEVVTRSSEGLTGRSGRFIGECNGCGYSPILTACRYRSKCV